MGNFGQITEGQGAEVMGGSAGGRAREFDDEVGGALLDEVATAGFGGRHVAQG